MSIPGINVNPLTGLVSGQATTPGVYSGVVFRVTDSVGATADYTLPDLTIVAGTFAAPVALTSGPSAASAAANTPLSLSPSPNLAPNCLELAVIEAGNEFIDIPVGWTQILAVGQGTAAAAGASSLQVFMRMQGATVNTADVTFGTGNTFNHLCGYRMAWSGVDLNDPIDTVSVSMKAAASTAYTCPATTAHFDNCYVQSILGIGLDASSVTLTSVTNTDLTGLTSATSFGTTVGTGGVLARQGGVKTTAGEIVPWSGTHTSATSVGATIVLKPAPTPDVVYIFTEDF